MFATRGAMPAQDAAILKAVFTHSPAGLHILDCQLRVVRTSSATGGPPDMSASALLGRPFTEVCDLAEPEEEAAVARRVLETGEPVVNRMVRCGRTSGPSTASAHSISYFRVEDSQGNVVGLVAWMVDVTERENARERLAVLENVRTKVGHRLNVMDVCWELVEAVVPGFASMAEVEVIEDVVRGEDPPLVPVSADTPLRRAAFHGLIAGHPVGVVGPLSADTPFSDILSDPRPHLVMIDEGSSWLAADPARADVIRRSGAHSLIVAPLVLRGHALGVVSFYRRGQEDAFDHEDVAVVSAVCTHAALCVDNARQFMREWIIARTVQRRLLPHRPVSHATVEISELYLPGPEGGGAWSDVIPLPGARTALIVGDVAGQGIAAAITMGLLRTAVHTLAALDLQPDELLARLSDTAARLVAARATLPPRDPLHREPLTAGCVIATYDPIDLTCTMARAGLAEPVAVLPDGTSAGLSVPPGPELAGPGNAPFPAITVRLPEGSTLAMSTVTVVDEVRALSAALRPLLDGADTRPLPDLREDFAQALTGGRRTGETQVLLVRTKALPRDRVLTCALPADSEAAPIARAEVRRQLEAWGIDEETAFTTELIVSELVGNAIRYGAPPLRLRLVLERMLTSEVRDAATSAPQVKHARTVDETGRGLFIIASIAEQWGTRYEPAGKTVWAEQPTGLPGGDRGGAGEPA
ncbi:SpoIIE family protein phosphatase [Streptomyces sp. NPDC002265]|uniref:SpoIIE family protein phosphatase n=1 Tax=Streptomyces sp. NPDC002265 TaxID=3154415 RepID=UPI00332A4A05